MPIILDYREVLNAPFSNKIGLEFSIGMISKRMSARAVPIQARDTTTAKKNRRFNTTCVPDLTLVGMLQLQTLVAIHADLRDLSRDVRLLAASKGFSISINT